MEHFLLNSTACLFVLWLTYKLLLENTSWHRFKRYYLLSAIVISSMIPLIVVETTIIPIENTPIPELTAMPVSLEINNQPEEFAINWEMVSLLIYMIGILIMLWRFIKNLITFRIQNGDKIDSYGNYQLILRNLFTVPHSFLRRIFVAQSEYEKDEIPLAVLEHEKAHLDQKHSIDILIMELLLVVFWFNPLLYILRYSMKLNHEFLADQAVIQQGNPVNDYQKTLLHYTQQSHSAALANSFNFPIIKKRFSIMKTRTSHTSLLIRSLVLIPVLVLLVMSCGKEETKFEEIKNTKQLDPIKKEFGEKTIMISNFSKQEYLTVGNRVFTYELINGKATIFDEKGKEFDYKKEGYKLLIMELTDVGETPELIDEYNRLAKKHKEYMDQNDLIVFKDETARMQIIFNSMSDEQRAQNEPWPYLNRGHNLKAGEIPPPPPPVSEPDSITQKELEEYNWLLERHKEFLKNEKRIVIFKEDTKRMIALYSSMSTEQLSKVEPWSYLYKTDSEKIAEILPPPPPAPVDFNELIYGVKKGTIKVFIGDVEQTSGQIQKIKNHLDSKENINVSFSSYSEEIIGNVKHIYFGNMVFSDLEQNTDFENWRVKNNRTSSFPTPLDHIDFYGDDMNYYINNEKVSASKAKTFIQKNGNKGVQIMLVNGVNSLKMYSEKNEQVYNAKDKK